MSATALESLASSSAAATIRGASAVKPKRGRRARNRMIVNAVVVVFAFMWIIPVYWMLNSAFQSDQALQSTDSTIFPTSPTLENFTTILNDQSFWSAMGVSLSAALICVVATTFASLLAAFAASRYSFMGKRGLIVAILVIQMIPAEALFISQYRMLDGWHLLNSVGGLSLLYIGGVLPFVTWMMRGYVDGVSPSLEEAAMVDGCSRLSAFARITLPLLAPGIISTSVFSFLHAWNEYTLALVILSDNSSVTLPIWLQGFQQGLKDTSWGGVMAGSTLIALPVIILFAFVQRGMNQSLASGAVKG